MPRSRAGRVRKALRDARDCGLMGRVGPPAPGRLPIPDLLCADARVRIDTGSFAQALVFAFAAGAPLEAFDEVIGHASLPASSWEGTGFSRDLYVGQIVQKCLEVRIDGKSRP